MLVAENISVGFDHKALIQSLSFELSEGQICGVCGPSGVGKSTLLRALAWLTPISAGAVSFEGRSPEQWGIVAWRRRILYVPQDPPHILGSLAQFARRVGTLRCSAASQEPSSFVLDVRTWGERLGLQSSKWTSEFSNLSGGEQRRALLALALARDAAVLLLDEPTNALDEENKRIVEAALSGRTALWITHDRGQLERVSHQTLELNRV